MCCGLLLAGACCICQCKLRGQIQRQSAAEVVACLGGKQRVNVVGNTIAGCEYCE